MFRAKVAIIIALMLFITGPMNLISKSRGIEGEEIPEWGFYVYMAGDNTLYEELDDDLNEMKMIGSNENLEIVTLTDQILSNDSHAYHVIKDGLEHTSLNQINNTWENEVDMGNKNTLRDFMIWASTEYPAQKKILVIWNHGSGWKKVAEDKTNHLTVPEIRQALEEYREVTNDPPLTLIGFDACLMGMFEIAYELKEEAEMIHGSEAYEPLEGWTYNHLLYKLKPQLTNIELANHIVNDYVESYRNGSVYTSYSVTSAVMDTSKLELLWNELNNFSTELKSVDPVYHNQTEISREETQRYDQNPDYRDLYDLTVNIKNNIPVSDLHNYANKLQQAIEDTVIKEDHWRKCVKIEDVDEDCKLPVDRAHGLTIYFPTDGPESGYDDLAIKNNNWYTFIEQFSENIASQANFNYINAKSVDTGTGYNDSVKINGSYQGNANMIKIRLLNDNGNVTNSYNGNISMGNISELYLHPTKSGNYLLEMGLYNEEGSLEDHYLIQNLYIDLHLPDLSVILPKILIEDLAGNQHEVQNLEKDDEFILKGEVYNIGTIPANNVTILVNIEQYHYSFNFSEIGPNESKTWILNNTINMNDIGKYNLEVSVLFENDFEIDPLNNQITFSFDIFDNVAHEYSVNTRNKNIIEIELNQNNEYEFPWLESYVTITNNKRQSWDLINITSNIPDGWEIQASPFLQLSETSEILVKIKPSIDTETGEYKIKLNMTDRNNIFSGSGEVTVRIPQYYGVRISAKQIDDYAEIIIENKGNGNDFFNLNKELEEGLTLYLPETRFELNAFETKTIKTIGLATTNSNNYEASFTVLSEGNPNITATVTLTLINPEKIKDNSNQQLILGGIGLIGVIYLLYQRRIK